MLEDNKRLYNLLFIISVIAFIACKIPALNIPYFWDELGVYSRSSIYLAQHGLGLLPSNLPPDISRGHPLLFPFVFGAVFKLFGASVFTGHILALIISVLLVGSLYYMVRRVSNGFIALLSTALLMVQPVFYAQSVMVLPEIMLTLFSLWAVYACYTRNWLLFAIAASLAIMVKESAVILPVLPISYGILLLIFSRTGDNTLNLKSIPLIISPWLIFGLFLVVQKAQNGWYFFPLHIGEVKLDLAYILEQNKAIQRFLFFLQGRYWWVKVFLAGGFMFVLLKNLRPRHSFFLVSLLFVLGYIAFSSVNFFMDRYALAVLPLLCWFVVASISQVCNSKIFVTVIACLLIGVTVPYINEDNFRYDCNMGYTRMLDVQQKGIDYMCANVSTNEPIAAYFPMNFILYKNVHTGFSNSCFFKYISHYNDADPQLYIIQGSHTYDFAFPEHDYQIVKEWQNGFAWMRVWKHK